MGKTVPPITKRQEPADGPQEPQKVGSILSARRDDREPEDELDTLEKKFEKIKQRFHQGADGLYYVHDPTTGQWTAQAEV